MGGKPINNVVEKVDEDTFWLKMMEAIGVDKFTKNEIAIRQHLQNPDNFIEYGDLIFYCR